MQIDISKIIENRDILPAIDKKKPIYIYGVGKCGQELKKKLCTSGYNFRGFIDKKILANKDTPWLYYSEEKLLELTSDDQVVIGIFNREVNPKVIFDKLCAKSNAKVFDYLQFLYKSDDLDVSNLWLNIKFDFTSAEDNLLYALSTLKDQTSREIYINSIIYRAGGNLNQVPFGIGLDSQYFSPGIEEWNLPTKLNIIDCGAYDGDTLSSALQHNFEIETALCFEPDLNNFSKLTAFVNDQYIESATCLPNGTWSCRKSLFFSTGDLESSQVVTFSDTKVEVIDIDSVQVEKCNFLKIDVEGADLETLKGSKNLILKKKPYIAVAIYHTPSHIYEIPTFIYNNFPFYDLYIRQHGENTIDMVLYCVPK